MNDGLKIFLIIFFVVISIVSIIKWIRKNPEKNKNKNQNSFFNSFNNFYKSNNNKIDDLIAESVNELIHEEISKLWNRKNEFVKSLEKLETTDHEKYQSEVVKMTNKFNISVIILDIVFSSCCDIHIWPLKERIWLAISLTIEWKNKYGYLSLDALEFDTLINDKTSHALYLIANKNSDPEYLLIFADEDYDLITRLNNFIKYEIIYKKKHNIKNENYLTKEFIKKEKNFYTDMDSYFEYINDESEDYDEEYDFDSFDFDDDDWDEQLNQKQKTTTKDYYAILGVSKNATQEEIKIAFRKKAKEWHPDVCKKENAEAMFKDINEAYNKLISKT